MAQLTPAMGMMQFHFSCLSVFLSSQADSHRTTSPEPSASSIHSSFIGSTFPSECIPFPMKISGGSESPADNLSWPLSTSPVTRQVVPPPSMPAAMDEDEWHLRPKAAIQDAAPSSQNKKSEFLLEMLVLTLNLIRALWLVTRLRSTFQTNLSSVHRHMQLPFYLTLNYFMHLVAIVCTKAEWKWLFPSFIYGGPFLNKWCTDKKIKIKSFLLDSCDLQVTHGDHPVP